MLTLWTTRFSLQKFENDSIVRELVVDAGRKIEKSQMDSANSKDLRKQPICIKRCPSSQIERKCPTDCAGQAL